MVSPSYRKAPQNVVCVNLFPLPLPPVWGHLDMSLWAPLSAWQLLEEQSTNLLWIASCRWEVPSGNPKPYMRSIHDSLLLLSDQVARWIPIPCGFLFLSGRCLRAFTFASCGQHQAPKFC